MEVSLIVLLVVLCAMITFMSSGMPIPFALGGVGILAIMFFWGPTGYVTIANAVWTTFCGDNYVSIPMFLLMANILEKSGIADDMYECFYKWLGGISGGLAMGTVVICAVFAAMCGGSGAATITMGLIALPSMLKRGYDKHLAMGVIAAGGVLGIIIPPSIPMVILSQYTKTVSVGRLFFSGVIPGILCAVIYCAYIGIRCALNPNLCPAIPENERVSMKEKLRVSKAVLAPAVLIIFVLGSIYAGVATPTEAAGIGAGMSIVIALLKRKLTVPKLKDALRRTLSLMGMILWILTGAQILTTAFNYMGVDALLKSAAASLPGGATTVIACMMLLNFVLGALMDDYAVITITAPIYIPIIVSLGIDPLWFCMLFMLNLQMAYLTPPYGFNIFFLKSIVPDGITLKDIYRSVLPFIALQILALLICWIFPGLITWLPSRLI